MSHLNIEIDLELRRIFENYARENSIRLFSIESANEMNVHFLSEITKYRLMGTQNVGNSEKEFRLSVVVKTRPNDEKFGEMIKCEEAFKNENIAYTVIVPNLRMYSTKSLPFVECIFPSDTTIILRDISEQGFKLLDKHNGFSVDIVKLILGELANFHASSLIMQHKNRKRFDEISCLVEELVYKLGNESSVMFLTLKTSLEKVLKLIDVEGNFDFSEIANVLIELKATNFDRLNKLLAENRPFSVINHGDLWANNIMAGNGIDVKLIDLQLMRKTSVAADLSYLLWVNLEPQFRLQHQQEFLQYYLDDLHIHLDKGNVPFAHQLTIEWLNGEMSDFALFGLVCAFWILPVFYHNFDTVERSEETFLNQFSLSPEDMVNLMVPEEKIRIVNLIRSYELQFRK